MKSQKLKHSELQIPHLVKRLEIPKMLVSSTLLHVSIANLKLVQELSYLVQELTKKRIWMTKLIRAYQVKMAFSEPRKEGLFPEPSWLKLPVQDATFKQTSLVTSPNSNKMTSKEAVPCSFKEQDNETMTGQNKRNKARQHYKNFKILKKPKPRRSSNTILTLVQSLMGWKKKKSVNKVWAWSLESYKVLPAQRKFKARPWQRQIRLLKFSPEETNSDSLQTHLDSKQVLSMMSLNNSLDLDTTKQLPNSLK